MNLRGAGIAADAAMAGVTAANAVASDWQERYPDAQCKSDTEPDAAGSEGS
jgi:hypothetical protein